MAFSFIFVLPQNKLIDNPHFANSYEDHENVKFIQIGFKKEQAEIYL